MKILLASDSFDPAVGGVQRVAHDLAHGLADGGHTVHVVTPWMAGTVLSENLQGVPVTRVRLGRPALRPRAVLGFARRIGPARRAVGKLAAELQPDVVHLHFLQSPLAYLLPGAARRAGAALIGTVHGRDVGDMIENDAVGRAVVRRMLRRADAVTAPSEATLRVAHDLVPEARGTFRVVHNALPRDVVARLRSPVAAGEPGRVVAIGELHPKKGMDVLIRAVSAVPELRLRVLGEGPARADLEALIQRHGVGKRVELVGFVDRNQLLHEIDAAAVQVVPSRKEPFGLVLLEGFAAGKAVIASRVDGIPEVVGDNNAALLVPPDDIEALADALRTLIAQPRRRTEFGRRARERARAFSQEATTGGYESLYDEVLTRRGRPTP